MSDDFSLKVVDFSLEQIQFYDSYNYKYSQKEIDDIENNFIQTIRFVILNILIFILSETWG